jgi:hypothetical protein
LFRAGWEGDQLDPQQHAHGFLFVRQFELAFGIGYRDGVDPSGVP